MTKEIINNEQSSSCGSEMLERLVNSHFSLFRRLNQINNKEPQSEATQKALKEAMEVNRFFADKDSPKLEHQLNEINEHGLGDSDTALTKWTIERDLKIFKSALNRS